MELLQPKIQEQRHEKRIFGLDAMRAVAILLVVIHHGFNVFNFRFIPLPDGVDIFFVLSGFLIGSIIIKTIERNQQFGFTEIRLFLLRRWFRTLPALWLTLLVNLLITFVLTLQEHSLKETIKQMVLRDKLWKYFLFLQNLYGNLASGFFSESWSLSVEEWFYLLLPSCLFLLLKFKFKVQKSILISILIMIGAPCFARYFGSDIHDKGTWMLTRMIVIMRLDSIGYGVLIAYIHFYKPQLWNLLATSRLAFKLCILLYYLSFLIVNQQLLYFNSITLTNFIFYPLSGFLIMLALPGISRQKGLSGLNRTITYISKISYSMYLVNYSIITQLILIFTTANTSQTKKFLLYLVYWILTICLSSFMYRYVEQPFMRMRDRYFPDK